MYRKFYEDGGDTMQPDSSGQGIMQAAPQDMQQGMQQPQLAGQDQNQPQIKDPHHALQIIIQMLIAQGIPPEQAKQIAMEMIKAVAEGGMQEVTSDEKVHARFGGHITRQHYLFGGIGRTIGNIVGGVGKAVSGVVGGVVNAVKSVAKSDLGKMALTAAALYFGGPMLAGATEGTAVGSSLFGVPTFGAEAATSGILGMGGEFAPLSGSLLGPATQYLNQSGIGGALSGMLPGKDTLTNLALGFGAGQLLGGQKPPEQNPGETPAQYQARVDAWKKTLNTGLTNPTLSAANSPANQFVNNPFYAQRRAEGGRIGYASGGIGDIINQATKESFFGTPMMANGGRMGYLGGGLSGLLSSSGVATAEANPSGGGNTSGFGGMLGRLIEQHPEMFKREQDISSLTPEELQALLDKQRANVAQGGVPLGDPRKNNQGISELDYRRKGGFVPPIGVKEKADDIPAMLSNNEFVFTANAVRNAGKGNPNLGAKRMYRLMKHLEAGGVA